MEESYDLPAFPREAGHPPHPDDGEGAPAAAEWSSADIIREERAKRAQHIDDLLMSNREKRPEEG